MTDIDSVCRFLARFASPDAIAEECRERGIHGEPQWADRCVIANLVKSVFDDATDVEVTPCTHGTGLITIADSARRLPEAANALAIAFDDGLYWDLQAGEPEEDDDDDTDEWEAEDEEHVHGEPVGGVA